MLTTISQYLKQRIEALNYMQQVYGIGQLLQVNGEQIPSVNVNGEQVHVNFDNHSSLVFFLKNGNVGHSAEEHPFLANADLITKTYPLRLILYSQALENTDCNSLSQSLADNIISSLNGEQAAFKASVSVDRCRIEFGNTDLDKYSVWESLYSIDSVLKDTDVLIAIEFTVTIVGIESCFTSSPCDTPDLSFSITGETFCERVKSCISSITGLAEPVKFTGTTYSNSLLAGLTPDVGFWVVSDEGSGTILKVNDGYTFSGTTITAPAGNYRVLIFGGVQLSPQTGITPIIISAADFTGSTFSDSRLSGKTPMIQFKVTRLGSGTVVTHNDGYTFSGSTLTMPPDDYLIEIY